VNLSKAAETARKRKKKIPWFSCPKCWV